MARKKQRQPKQSKTPPQGQMNKRFREANKMLRKLGNRKSR